MMHSIGVKSNGKNYTFRYYAKTIRITGPPNYNRLVNENPAVRGLTGHALVGKTVTFGTGINAFVLQCLSTSDGSFVHLVYTFHDSSYSIKYLIDVTCPARNTVHEDIETYAGTRVSTPIEGRSVTFFLVQHLGHNVYSCVFFPPTGNNQEIDLQRVSKILDHDTEVQASLLH